MRRTLFAASLLAALLLASVGAARADTLSVSADVPIVYTFDESQLHDAKASGAIIGVSLPFLVGFGGESYKVKGKGGTAPTEVDIEYKVQMFDVFFDIPFPVANLRLGGGLGKGDFSIPSSPTTQFDKANLTQLFFNVGIPFGGVFDVHVGYHVINGETEETGVPGSTLKVSAKMGTIGLKAGF
jgi:hypothetical protein